MELIYGFLKMEMSTAQKFIEMINWFPRVTWTEEGLEKMIGYFTIILMVN